MALKWLCDGLLDSNSASFALDIVGDMNFSSCSSLMGEIRAMLAVASRTALISFRFIISGFVTQNG
jgi:hypothetical protein